MPQGKGLGSGSGRGGGSNSIGGGRGRNNGGAFGAGGDCVCAGCGYKTAHQRGVKCTELKCPECGRAMIREELLESRRK